MTIILQNLIPYLIVYKYAAVFAVSFWAAFIIPIPSGSLLMAASAYARFGSFFNIYYIITLSIIANILGDNLGYFMARIYGKRVLSRIGFRRILESKSFGNLENKFNKHPGFIIFASRFEVLSTLSVNLLSGLSKTPYRKYLSHEVPGSVAQVCLYSMIGYLFADNWETINSTIGRVSLVVILALVLIIISLSKKKVMKKLD